MFFALPRSAAGTALFVLMLSIFAEALGQVPVPSQGSTRLRAEPAPRQPGERAEISLPVFEFHNGFWVNLHHFLYQQARLRQSAVAGKPAVAGPTSMADRAPSASANPDALSEDQQRAWAASLDYYASALAGRDLLFDSEMVAIKNRLAELDSRDGSAGQDSVLEKSGLRPELVVALQHAAPVYRALWWNEHNRANRSWIEAVTPLVRQIGGTLAEQLAAVYHADWPAGRIRVDVTVYAGRVGGYTSLEPLHVTISSTDPRNHGPAALEVLFHEASHALAGGVREEIARECRTRNKPIPRDLWHALLFYTTGEIVKRALGNYVPYAYRHALYARGWQNYQRLLETHWQPYLDGKEDFDRALLRLVAAL